MACIVETADLAARNGGRRASVALKSNIRRCIVVGERTDTEVIFSCQSIPIFLVRGPGRVNPSDCGESVRGIRYQGRVRARAAAKIPTSMLQHIVRVAVRKGRIVKVSTIGTLNSVVADSGVERSGIRCRLAA